MDRLILLGDLPFLHMFLSLLVKEQVRSAGLNSLGEPFSIDYLNWIGLLRPYLTAVSGGRSGWSVEPVAIQWQVTGEGKTEPFKRQTASQNMKENKRGQKGGRLSDQGAV